MNKNLHKVGQHKDQMTSRTSENFTRTLNRCLCGSSDRLKLLSPSCSQTRTETSKFQGEGEDKLGQKPGRMRAHTHTHTHTHSNKHGAAFALVKHPHAEKLLRPCRLTHMSVPLQCNSKCTRSHEHDVTSSLGGWGWCWCLMVHQSCRHTVKWFDTGHLPELTCSDIMWLRTETLLCRKMYFHICSGDWTESAFFCSVKPSQRWTSEAAPRQQLVGSVFHSRI